MKNLDMLSTKILSLFVGMLLPYKKRRPVISHHHFVAADFTCIKFQNAKKVPLFKIMQHEIADELNSVCIWIKEGDDQFISKADLDWFCLEIDEDSSNLHILVTRGHVPNIYNDRLFSFFEKKLSLALMLGDTCIERMWKWYLDKNYIACFLYLFISLERIVSLGEDEENYYTSLYRDRNDFIDRSLDTLGKLKGPQPRTIMNKLLFLINYIPSQWSVKKACKRVKISRKTFYNWYETDPVFRSLVGDHSDIGHHNSKSYQNSIWFQEKQKERILNELWKKVNATEITHENP